MPLQCFKPWSKNLVWDWESFCISDQNQDDTSLSHCDLLFSRLLGTQMQSYLRQICGYLVLQKCILVTSFCNICPWQLNYRHQAVNFINLCHKAECFLSHPAEDRVDASLTVSRDTEAGYSQPSGKRPGVRTYRINLSYKLCFFSFQSNNEEREKKILDTHFIFKELFTSDCPY